MRSGVIISPASAPRRGRRRRNHRNWHSRWQVGTDSVGRPGGMRPPIDHSGRRGLPVLEPIPTRQPSGRVNGEVETADDLAYLGEAVRLWPVGHHLRCHPQAVLRCWRDVDPAPSRSSTGGRQTYFSSHLERGNTRFLARAHPTPDTPNRVCSSIFTSGILSSTGCSPSPVCSKVRTGPPIRK
jgi:hypothetical protein